MRNFQIIYCTDVCYSKLSNSCLYCFTDLPFALSNHLSFLPYLVLLETLKTTPTNTPEGRSLRKQLLEVGVVHHTLQCLSSAGHHSPRVDSGEAEPMQMEGGRYTHNIAIIISQEFRIEIANFYMYCICKCACEINVCIQ